MTSTEQQNVGLTQRDILIRVDGKVDTLSADMSEVKANAVNAALLAQDHERRIRALEKFRYAIPSVAILSLLVSIVLMAYYLHPHHP